MTIAESAVVGLRLPREVIAVLPTEPFDTRGTSDLIIILNVIDAASGVITLASLRKSLPELASALRGWIHKQPQQPDAHNPTRLAVKGPGVDLEVELPPNVSSQKIIDLIEKTLHDRETDAPSD